MSKKNRYKFRDRPTANASVAADGATGGAVSGAAAVHTPRFSASEGAMSQHVAEYRIISKDLIRLIVVNGIMLAAVLVVYFTNRNNGYLERMFQNLIR